MGRVAAARAEVTPRSPLNIPNYLLAKMVSNHVKDDKATESMPVTKITHWNDINTTTVWMANNQPTSRIKALLVVIQQPLTLLLFWLCKWMTLIATKILPSPNRNLRHREVSAAQDDMVGYRIEPCRPFALMTGDNTDFGGSMQPHSLILLTASRVWTHLKQHSSTNCLTCIPMHL